MWYHYRSDVGTFWIGPDGSGRFRLGIDDERLGSYHSPKAAADDVYSQSTGCSEWDSLLATSEPSDLSEWTGGKPEFL